MEARGAGPRRQQEVMDAGGALQAAASQAGHAPYLRRGLDAIGSWPGTPLRDFLKLVGADTRAKYCWFQCADRDGYNSPLDMASALHPQTQMTFKFGDEILPRAYGYPMKVRVPTKLGFKNPKYVISMEVTNDYKGGYWEDQGYNSFSGS